MPSRCLSSREKSPASPRSNYCIPTSMRHYQDKLKKDIEAIIGKNEDQVTYVKFIEVLQHLHFVSNLGADKNKKERDLVAELWKTIGGTSKKTVHKELLIEAINCVMGIPAGKDFIGIDKKFAIFKTNRLYKSQNNETTIKSRQYSFSPKVSEKSTKFAFTARQKVIAKKQSRAPNSNSGLAESLSTPDLLTLQQTLRDEQFDVLILNRKLQEQQKDRFDDLKRECTFQPNIGKSSSAFFSTLQSKSSTQKCKELYNLAKPKTKDVTTEEYLLRKDKEEYTFRPSISRVRPKSTQGQYCVKGKERSIKRLQQAQKVCFQSLYKRIRKRKEQMRYWTKDTPVVTRITQIQCQAIAKLQIVLVLQQEEMIAKVHSTEKSTQFV
eukprot:TRINITY_DN137884_c0_g1_i1.p2 TRINITY_DN137884_c0_g1~~TRINITY_DN137884_c0_g1_i1.p2  ORF type:complete len:381 (-),score=29.00 TRINITY_DN137884_c0_g1_i1:399-1541(-)